MSSSRSESNCRGRITTMLLGSPTRLSSPYDRSARPLGRPRDRRHRSVVRTRPAADARRRAGGRRLAADRGGTGLRRGVRRRHRPRVLRGAGRGPQRRCRVRRHPALHAPRQRPDRPRGWQARAVREAGDGHRGGGRGDDGAGPSARPVPDGGHVDGLPSRRDRAARGARRRTLRHAAAPAGRARRQVRGPAGEPHLRPRPRCGRDARCRHLPADVRPPDARSGRAS